MIDQKSIELGMLLLKWGFVSEEVLAAVLIEAMKSERAILEILVDNGHINLYEKLFVLMEQSTLGLSENSSVAKTFASLPTSSLV